MIRPAGPHDAAACCALVQAGFETYRAFAPAGWDPPAEDTPEQVAHVTLQFARRDGFARVDVDVDDHIGGVVHWVPRPEDRPSADGWIPDAHLRWLFVTEDHWGDGLARRLHALAVAAMRERGVRAARLYTPAGQARARRFYEREGWTPRSEPAFEARFGLELVEYGLRISPDR